MYCGLGTSVGTGVGEGIGVGIGVSTVVITEVVPRFWEGCVFPFVICPKTITPPIITTITSIALSLRN